MMQRLGLNSAESKVKRETEAISKNKKKRPLTAHEVFILRHVHYANVHEAINPAYVSLEQYYNSNEQIARETLHLLVATLLSTKFVDPVSVHGDVNHEQNQRSRLNKGVKALALQIIDILILNSYLHVRGEYISYAWVNRRELKT